MLFVIKIKPAINKYGEWLSSWFSGRKSGTSMHKCSLLSFNIIASHGYAIMRKRAEVSYTLGEGSLWDAVGFSVHIVLYASNVQKPSHTHFFDKARFAACTAICMWHSMRWCFLIIPPKFKQTFTLVRWSVSPIAALLHYTSLQVWTITWLCKRWLTDLRLHWLHHQPVAPTTPHATAYSLCLLITVGMAQYTQSLWIKMIYCH